MRELTIKEFIAEYLPTLGELPGYGPTDSDDTDALQQAATLAAEFGVKSSSEGRYPAILWACVFGDCI